MKNASPLESVQPLVGQAARAIKSVKSLRSGGRLSSTSGSGGISSPNEFARRMKNLFSGNSPSLIKKKSMSLDALDSKPAASLMFGVPLAEICKREGGTVPFIVRRIVKHIEDEGLDQEGIYRVNGNSRVIERLKADFDRDGNANFEDVEIPAIGSVLKLFLRELPGGIVPEDFVSLFVKVQQRYPNEATPEALDKLKETLRILPTTNYNMLNYLIQHLTRVAKHSDKNKMTAVSLSIVFGPNIFPCGSGIEALKLQGYSNATTCRMIQNYRTLFDRRRGQKREPPEKPQPYTEHKKQKQEAASAIAMETEAGSTHDLECSHSERSIDEAIEKSSGTLSPTSPIPIMEDEEIKPKNSPLHPVSDLPLVVEPYREEEGKAKKLSLGRSKSLDKSSSDEGESRVEQSFHRQYAKRGMKFKTRHSVSEGTLNMSRPPLVGGDQILRHPHLTALNSREDELRTPSPYSWQSSPGTSPPTSPVLTPRSSRVVSSVIEDTVKNFLFQSSTNSTADNGKQAESPAGDNMPKADVYGLLLPASVNKTGDEANKPANGSDAVQLRQTTRDTKTEGVVLRHNKKLRNRRSAVYGGDEPDSATSGSNVATSPIHNMSVKLVSLSPENSIDKDGDNHEEVLETRQGRVSDLVKQFDEEEKVEASVKQGSESNTGGKAVVTDTNENSGEKRQKRKPINKAFDMFEKSGLIMGMGGPPPHTKSRAVSFASAVSTIPTLSTDDVDIDDGVSPSSNLITLRPTVGGESEDLTTVSKDFLSVSTCDEDVFASPSHSLGTNSSSASPSHVKGQRGQLGTTSSDDVFISPVHSSNQPPANESTDGGSELDAIKRTQDTLKHLTLSRPRGPVLRKKPRRTSAPAESIQVPVSSKNVMSKSSGSDGNLGESSKVLVSDEKKKEVAQQATVVVSRVDTKNENGKDQEETVVSSVNTGYSRTLQHKGPIAEKTKEDRMRLKSAAEAQPNSEVGSTELEQKSVKKSILDMGEDMTDGDGEHGKRVKSSQSGRRKNNVKESTTTRQRRKRHTVAGIEQLRSPIRSSSSSVEGGGGEGSSDTVSAVMSRMPLVDLTSLAPENQQAVSQVREGWKEGTASKTEADLTASQSAATANVKDVAQRIHELKSELRKFEDDFVTKHGHKPSSTEKTPVRTQLEEMSRLRKLYKELKEKERLSETNKQDQTGKSMGDKLQPVTAEERENPLTGRSQSVPGASNNNSSIERSQATTNIVRTDKSESLSAQPGEPERDSGKSLLQQSLDKIMAGLEARRKSSGRPTDPLLMTKEQALEEKQTIQKALLSFEKTHGRPQSKADKLVMKPLYDRYRQIKKICSGDFRKESHGSVSVVSPRESLPGLESTNDSLPSVTLLQSGMAKSLPSGPPGYAEPDTPLSKSALELLRVTSTGSESDSKQVAIVVAPSPKREVQPLDQLMSEKQLQAASLEEMKHQKQLFLARKRELRTVLKDFESAFMGLHGRSVARGDRKPMQREYDEYKSIKSRLITVDVLLKKTEHPLKTI